MDNSPRSYNVNRRNIQQVATRRRILITGPEHSDPGGVANYYNAVLPHLRAQPENDIHYLEIGRGGIGGPIRPATDQLRFYAHLRRRRPDVVHLNPSLNLKSLIRDSGFALSAKRLGIPLLVFFRGWDPDLAEQIGRRFRTLFRATLGRADAFIVLASDIEWRLRSWGIQSPISVDTTVVPDSALEGFALEAKIADISNAPEIRVLFLARLEVSKGVIETIEAVASLARAGLPVSLTVAGDGAALETVKRSANLDEVTRRHVRIAGYATGATKAEMFRDHHIYCLPTYYPEGMPNSLIEAMAFGLPVITSPVGGIADMFVEGKMGYLVPPKGPEAIADAVRRLAQNRELLAGISRYNHEYATSRCLASQAAGRLTASYASLV